jgi:zinc protease
MAFLAHSMNLSPSDFPFRGHMNLRIAALENGLQVLLLESHTAPVATFWVWYLVGSRNELPGGTGISHWVEHMLFKGTPTYPKGTLTRYIDRLGGRWNAFTWKDYTAYHEVLPAEHLDVAVRLEADRQANTLFDSAEVESERTVIISEREGAENFPSYLLREEVDAAAHKVHPYRVPVIGWKEDLRTITRDDLYSHYRTYYQPNNAIAVAVGAFGADHVLEVIRDAFASIPRGPAPPAVRARDPEQEGERRLVLQRPGGATAYIHLAYHVPEASHPDHAALLVLDGLLSGFKSVVPFEGPGGSRSSRLHRALVESELASDAGSSLIPSVDPTLFRVVATARAGVEPAAVEERALAELERLAREPADPSELAKVKKQAKAQFAFAQDGVYRTALALGAYAVVDTPDGFVRLLDRLDRVTADDVMRVAATYLRRSHLTVGWYVPEPAGVTAPAPALVHRAPVFFAPRSPRAAAPAFPITPEVVTRTELHNGLVVLVREQRGSGLLGVHGYVRAGAMFDGEQPGLARYTSSLLQRGTRTRTSQEIAETLESMGASLGVFSNMEVTSLGLRVLREDARPALEVLAEILQDPAFPADEVEKARGELLTGLRVARQDTRHVAERAFRALAFPHAHPHARVADGEEAVIAAITPADLAAFHARHIRPEATILAFVGDIAVPEVLDLASRLFSQWRRAGVWQLPPLPPPATPSGPQRVDVRLAGKTQSDVILGAPGIVRNDPRYYETMTANLILGQIGLMGRLGERVRERLGMAYYAYSDLRAGLLAGPWWVRAGVNPKNEDRAVESILQELREFQETGPTDEELRDARDFLVGSLAVRLETTGGIAQMLADIELFDLGLDYVTRYPGIIRGITREAVIAAAAQFPLTTYGLAIAGPPPAS